MKKILFAIFAHPDDEAFGPAGALIKAVDEGTELHLVTLTSGQAGINSENHPDLGKVRLEEWRASGNLIGASYMHHLGFEDGKLNNIAMIEAQAKIEEIVRTTISDNSESEISVEFMTIDLNGVTGHIDHIVAARSASFVFYTLKQAGLPLTNIRYACISKLRVAELNVHWLFMEPGRGESDINETIDAKEYIEKIKQVMHCHYTQRHDAQSHLDALGDDVAICDFIVRD